MATYATYRHIELDKVGYSKKRVRNPSSEILNVLYNPCGADKKSYQSRRTSPNDSFTRLFGCSENNKQAAPRRNSFPKPDVTSRNPVTGNGVLSYDSRINRGTQRVHTERNPVTGEVYQIVTPATVPVKSDKSSQKNGKIQPRAENMNTKTEVPVSETNGGV